MTLFDRLFGSKKVAKKVDGYEIEETAKCAKCGKKMHIPKVWVPTSRQGGKALEGSQCQACGKYMCRGCTFDLHSGRFRCCSEVTKGVIVTSYFE